MSGERPLRLGLVLNGSHRGVAAAADRLGKAAAERGMTTATIDLESGGDVDIVIGIGGDGTLLEAAEIAHRFDLPVAGVNLGTVGYLTEFEPERPDRLLDAVADEAHAETMRMTLEATTGDGGRWHGINDVVLEKVVTQRVVTIAVTINGAYFTTFRADAIIIATPLGSTAYSLSAGGPVLDPALEALVLTPVAPHSLLSRSIVLHPGTDVEFEVAGDRPVRVNLDGREAATVGQGEVVHVRRGARPVRFISGGGEVFPQAVRRQFGLDHA